MTFLPCLFPATTFYLNCHWSKRQSLTRFHRLVPPTCSFLTVIPSQTNRHIRPLNNYFFINELTLITPIIIIIVSGTLVLLN